MKSSLIGRGGGHASGSGQAAAIAAILIAAALLAATGCGGSSPTAPDGSGGGADGATVVFVGANPVVAEQQATIVSLLEATYRQARDEIPLGPVRFVVSADPARSIPGWGMGGYTLGPSEIEIVLDPAFPLGSLLPARLPQIAAHELHHTSRLSIPDFYGTLLEAMVSEGLADHFAVELLGVAPAPWSNAFPESDTARYLALARPELDDPGYDFDAWFFGTTPELPHWTGYTLGFRLVRDYLAANPGTSAASLVHTPAEAFRPD